MAGSPSRRTPRTVYPEKGKGGKGGRRRSSSERKQYPINPPRTSSRQMVLSSTCDPPAFPLWQPDSETKLRHHQVTADQIRTAAADRRPRLQHEAWLWRYEMRSGRGSSASQLRLPSLPRPSTFSASALGALALPATARVPAGVWSGKASQLSQASAVRELTDRQ